MKLTLKKRLSLYIVAISAAIFLISIFIIVPGVGYVIGLRNDVKKTQAELDNSYNRAKLLRRSIQEIDQVKKNTEKFSEATLPFNRELEIITELEDLAAEHNIEQNLNINFFDTKTTKPEGTDAAIRHALPAYYQLSFLNNGNFIDQLKYLSALEKKPYYVIINDLNFEKRRNDTASSTPVTLRFAAIIYAQ